LKDKYLLVCSECNKIAEFGEGGDEACNFMNNKQIFYSLLAVHHVMILGK